MRARANRADYQLVAVALVLSIFGVLMVYSAGQTQLESSGPDSRLWIAQLRWLAVALVAAYVMSRLPMRVIEGFAWPAYLFGVALLVLTVAGFGSGAGTAEGTTSWLMVGGRRLGQPSELAKIGVVLAMAKVLSASKDAPTSLLQLWKPMLLIAVPGALIVKQGDLGTAIVLVGIFFGMLFWAGLRWQLLILVGSPVLSLIFAFSNQLWGLWFIALTIFLILYRPILVEGIAILLTNVASGIAAQIIWDSLHPYRKARLLTFLDSSLDPKSTGYNVNQSETAIGSGGWFGQGFNEGTQKGLSFIPEQATDFIFAVVGEELGFLGVSIALGLFLALFLRTTRIAFRAHDSFSGLVAFGLTAIVFVHVVVNVGMTVRLMPVTGIPLPFFSYGGSFLLTCWICVGILHRVSKEGRGVADVLAT